MMKSYYLLHLQLSVNDQFLYNMSERFKTYKSFDSFKYFLNSFVGSAAGIRKAENYVVLGKVQ